MSTPQPTFDDLKLGAILLIVDDTIASPLPLEKTEIKGNVIGAVADVTVIQQFGNPYDNPIELEYLFPLPHEGAVVDYEITIGSRTIKAELKEIEAARQTYQQAVDEGKRASLLEQRRPNLFVIQIGNVQPKETIITRLRYEEHLKYSDDTYEFVFPMGITPRYHSPEFAAQSASSGSVDSPIALSDDRIAPVEIELKIDAGVSIQEPTSTSHQLALSRIDERRFAVNLAGDNIPNKDFVLRYSVANDQLQTAVWGSQTGDVETLLITLLPPRLDLTVEGDSREFIFVIDRSGSMSGQPIIQARNALHACLRAMSEKDTFWIQAFDDRIEWFDTKATAVSEVSVSRADQWINLLDARGGTEMQKAINDALTCPIDNTRQRYVVFLTDGAVSADEEMIKRIYKQRGDARIFTFGIGPSVNRYILNKMAQMGRGVAKFLGNNDDIELAITQFQDRVSYPTLLDINLVWEGAQAWDTYPTVLPDLYIGQPLEIVTHFKRQESSVKLKLQGKIRGNATEISMNIPPTTGENRTLNRLWARARIESLTDENILGRVDEKRREQIISLALEHRLVTAYTAFVAVDSEVTDSDKETIKVKVAVPLPEGLDIDGFMDMSAYPMRAVPPGGASMAYYAMSPVPQSAAPKGGGGFVNRLVGGLRDISGNAKLSKRKAEAPTRRARMGSFESSDASPDELEEADAGVLYLLDVDEEVQKPSTFESVEDRLKWLARTQKVNGGWDDNLEQTAAAILAFIRAGHTTRVGNYRRQVTKAAQWLQTNFASTAGLALFVGWRALSELEQKTGDVWITDDMRSQLPTPTSDLEKAFMGDTTVSIPTNINSLDDLRMVALMVGNATLTTGIGNDAALYQTWMAVGPA